MLVTLLSWLAPQTGLAADKDSFPPTIELGDRTLVLNGVGTRTATIFAVRVYHGALYLEQRSSDADEIVGSEGWKQIRMRFVRDVDAEKLREGFREGVQSNVEEPQRLLGALEAFLSILPAVKDGEELSLSFFDQHVDVHLNGTLLGKVDGTDLSHALLLVWLGPKPPNRGLKQGLLGKG